MAKDTSGPAFPGEQGTSPDGTWNQTWSPGMTIRQWYAGMAMQGIIATHCGQPTPSDALVVKWAFEMADAMLAHEAKEAEGER